MTQTAFLSTKIIDKKPYPRRGHSKFRLYLDTVRIFIKYLSKESQLKYCFQVLVTCIQVLASKLSTNAKFQKLQDWNSRTFQGLSSTFKHLICFQALSTALKFLFQIQAFSRISQARYEPCKKYQQLFQTIHPRWVDKVGRWCPRLHARVL